MIKRSLLLSAITFMVCACSGTASDKNASQQQTAEADTLPVVYHITDISSENLIKIYNALGLKAEGNNVAVKISTGESEKSNQLNPDLIKDFVHSINGTFIECNTAYGGNRANTADHRKAAIAHGYTAVAPVDIMDADGDTTLAVENGFHLPYDIVGKHFLRYDFMVVLSHFKGHQMGGFGGALKNISIGIASSAGKAFIHTAGKVDDPAKLWDNLPEQDHFLESMADACKAVITHMNGHILYISVANNLSVDCDCNGNPAAPEMDDLGIYASLDPVALDRACVDAVFNSSDPGKKALIERINSRHGTHILDAAEQHGLGSQHYRLVTIE